MLTREEVLAAARAVAAEEEDRAGVATYLALVDRTLAAPAPAGGAPPADDAELAADVELAWSVLREADPRTSVQDALAAVAWLRLRPSTGSDSPVPGSCAGPSAPQSLAAWAPAGSAPPLAERDAEATLVREALLGGRVLRVVNYHNTPARSADALHAELSWYARRFSAVTADDVHVFLDTGRWAQQRPGIVPAFFDGFASAAQVAAPLCEELGLTGWFYPPTEFLDTPVAEQRAFAARHDFGVLAEDLAGAGRLAMTWEELAALAERHVVCGHTAAHAASSTVRSAEEVQRQVLTPLHRLVDVLGAPPAAWAWLGGTPFEAGAPGDEAVRHAGVRLVCSDSLLERVL